jgi:pimeloyl-ACP methyl ester carboxylesterase
MNSLMLNKVIQVIVFFLLMTPFVSCSQKTLKTGLIEGKPIVIGTTSYKTITGYIEVPENYENQNSTKIKLPVYIVKSPNKTALEPVFWLDGGPGGSNILSNEKIISSSPTQLLANHDFVCLGYRGVDGSVVLKSEEVKKTMKGLNHHLYTDECLDNIEKSVVKYKAELNQKNIDINQYNVVNVAKDVEFLRNQLGYQKINILSVSFGTRVALLYAYQYADKLHRTIMIGAAPQGSMLMNPEDIEKYISKYDSIFASQIPSKYEIRLKEAMKTAFDNMPKKWGGFTLNMEKIKTGTVNALYATGFATMVFDAYYNAALKQDYSGLFLMQKVYDMGRSNAVGDVFAKSVSADLTPEVQLLLGRENIRKSDTLLLGSNYALLYGGTYKAWGLKPIPSNLQQPQKLNNEIVVVSGDLDFRSPPEVTEKKLMPYLNKGQHIVLENSSHLDILKTVLSSPEFLGKFFTSGIADKTLLPSRKPLDINAVQKVGKFKIWVAGVIK